MILALDPGTRRLGLALAGPDRVHWAGGVALDHRVAAGVMIEEALCALPAAVRRSAEVITLISEWPAKYAAKSAAHEDIDGLRGVVAGFEVAARWQSTRRVSPRAWKGQVPKHIHHHRIAEALTASERALLDWLNLTPDARDAVGIALWYTRRLVGPARR